MSMAFPPLEHWDLEVITVPATAGNATYQLIAPTGYRYLVLRGNLILVCDGNAANRIIANAVTDGTNLLRWFQKSGAVTAGQTRSLGYAQELKDLNMTDIDNFTLVIRDLYVDDSVRLEVSITDGVAGDSFSGFFLVFKIRV